MKKSNSIVKVFEINQLEFYNNNYYISGKISFNGDAASVKLQIDPYIYQQFEESRLDPKARYRLSLQSKYHPFSECYHVVLTKYANHKVNYIYLDINEKFHKTLIHIQSSSCINELHQVESLIIVNDSYQQPKLKKQTKIMKELSYRQKPVFRMLFAFAAIFILLTGMAFAQDSINTLLGNDQLAAEHINENIVPYSSTEIIGETGGSHAEIIPPNNPHVRSIKIDETSTRNIPKGLVALTFDDGPSRFTKSIVDVLQEHGIAATFFFIGQNVEEYPDGVKYATQHNMSIQSHSWSHRDAAKLSSSHLIDEIVRTNDLLTDLTNVPVTLFRPPYGSRNQLLLEELNKQGMNLMLWNRDPKDWGAKKSTEIVNFFQNSEHSGSVYLLHENRYTLEALPEIITHIKQSDLEFVILH